jgi:hypothetical protein
MIELGEDLVLRKPFEPESQSNGTFFGRVTRARERARHLLPLLSLALPLSLDEAPLRPQTAVARVAFLFPRGCRQPARVATPTWQTIPLSPDMAIRPKWQASLATRCPPRQIVPPSTM